MAVHKALASALAGNRKKKRHKEILDDEVWEVVLGKQAVRDALKLVPPGAEVEIERPIKKRLACKGPDGLPVDLSGKPDVVYKTDDKTVVIDWKTKKHIRISQERSKRCGQAEAYRFLFDANEVIYAFIEIYKPRKGNPDSTRNEVIPESMKSCPKTHGGESLEHLQRRIEKDCCDLLDWAQDRGLLSKFKMD